MTQFRSIGRNNQPNIFLFDIQSDQKDAVAALVGSLGFPVVQKAPIVTMRLSEIKGRKSSDILADPQRKIPEWELEREYRSTYREQIVETEKVTAGKWIGRVDYHSGDVVPISLDREIAKDLGVNVGDELVFDVQGIPIRTRIASLRSVDWKRFQTNFFVVFPAGVLEAAPTFHVLVSRAKTPADSARLQNAIVSKFPNVSALDLAAVIQTVDSILSKVALVIRVMSLFTVAAGLIVVASAIWSGRYQRVEESVLLRTLGGITSSDLANPWCGIFPPWVSGESHRHRSGRRRELGTCDICFQAQLCSDSSSVADRYRIGNYFNGIDRVANQSRGFQPASP